MIAAVPIAIEGVGKRYVTPSGPIPAVEGVSLTVRPREFVSLLGPSGCGKSTVLGMIGGLVRLDSGSILIDGERVTGPNPKKVALVFQDPGLFPWRTALDNVGFGPRAAGRAVRAPSRDRAGTRTNRGQVLHSYISRLVPPPRATIYQGPMPDCKT